jgi:hypothetical protein
MNECLTSVANHRRMLMYGETWETPSLTYQNYAIRGALNPSRSIFQPRIENSSHLHRILLFTAGNSRPSRRFSAYQFSEAAEAPSAISTRTNCWTKFPEPWSRREYFTLRSGDRQRRLEQMDEKGIARMQPDRRIFSTGGSRLSGQTRRGLPAAPAQGRAPQRYRYFCEAGWRNRRPSPLDFYPRVGFETGV